MIKLPFALSLLSLLFFTGCGKKKYTSYSYEGTGGYSPYQEPPHTKEVPAEETVQKQGEFPKYVANYTISGSYLGSDRGPGGLYAFGTLITLKERTISRCSAFHFSKGLVLTNAHCLGDSAKPEAMYLVYWSSKNVSKRTRVVSLGEKGFESGVDAAMLHIDAKAAEEWPNLNGAFTDTVLRMGDELGKNPMNVTVWAMDQKDSSYGYDYSNINPKRCKATPRVVPVLKGYRDSSSSWIELSDTTNDPVYHLFYDSCTSATINGNSGSLVTDDSGKAVGIHFASFHSDLAKAKYSKLSLIGSAGIEILFTMAMDQMVYGVAASMDYTLTYLHLRD